MENNINITINKNLSKKLNSKINELLNLYKEETLKENKVSCYYLDINSLSIISINEDKRFYAASSIKILVCLILFEQAHNKKIDLNKKVLITMDEIKQGTGIIRYQNKDTEYTLLELIKLSLIESDNSAYIKLVNIVGKENIRNYGYSLGATHTMEGKESDFFGTINTKDMLLYWKKVKEFIDSKSKYSLIFENYLLNPSMKLINNISLNNNKFLRKYGSFGIAYHEAGIVLDENPYYLIILTQLNNIEYKEDFLNKTAKLISEIHKIINERSCDNHE